MSTTQVPVAGQLDRCPPAMLSLRMTTSRAVTIVTVSGEVDADNAHLIPELVDCLPDNQLQRLVLDLAQVTLLGAAGVEALLRVRDSVAVKGGQLILRNPSPTVSTVLAGTRVARGFHIHTRQPAS